MPKKRKKIQIQLYSKGTGKPKIYNIPIIVIAGWLLGLLIIVLAFLFWLPNNMINQKKLKVFEIAKEQRSIQLMSNKIEKQILELKSKLESGNSLRAKISQLSGLKNGNENVERNYKKNEEMNFEQIKTTLETFKKMHTTLLEDEQYAQSLPLLYPVRNRRNITNKFGIVQDPFTRMELPHRGLDFAINEGDTIIATGNGVVERIVKQRSGFGTSLEIQHSPRIKTVYSHLKTVLVQAGKPVKKGQAIATAGRSGSVLWPVLHYEVHLDNQPINPEEYFITP